MDEKPKEIHGHARDRFLRKPGKTELKIQNMFAMVMLACCIYNPNTGWIEKKKGQCK